MWCLYSVNLCNGELKLPYETENPRCKKKKTKQNTHTKKNRRNKTKKQKRKVKVKLSLFALLSLAVLKLETDNPSSKSVKTDGKQMDKVRRIIHEIFRPFHFQIKTYYLSGANYPTDNPSQTDNPSLM